MHGVLACLEHRDVLVSEAHEAYSRKNCYLLHVQFIEKLFENFLWTMLVVHT